MIELLWSKLPKYIKWPAAGIFFLFLVPLKLREEAINLIDTRVHAMVIPMKEKRDLELLQLREDVATIKQDTRDIKNHLMNRQVR